MIWKLIFTRQSQQDVSKLKSSNLRSHAETLLGVLQENPFRNPPPMWTRQMFKCYPHWPDGFELIFQPHGRCHIGADGSGAGLERQRSFDGVFLGERLLMLSVFFETVEFFSRKHQSQTLERISVPAGKPCFGKLVSVGIELKSTGCGKNLSPL